MLNNLYGTVVDRKLRISNVLSEGYKPVVYAPIPKFDQETQYVIQSEYVYGEENIWFGVGVKTVIQDINSKLVDVGDSSGFRP